MKSTQWLNLSNISNGLPSRPLLLNCDNIVCLFKNKESDCVTVGVVGNQEFDVQETLDEIMAKLGGVR